MIDIKQLDKLVRNKKIKVIKLVKKSLVIEFSDRSRLFVDNVNDLDEISYTE